MKPPTLNGFDHLVLTAADMEATIAFYTQVLGMTHKVARFADGTTRNALYFGPHKINLHQLGAEFEPKARVAGSGTLDLCFLTDTPLDDWQAHFRATGTTVELGPVPRTGAQWAMQSLYVRDPDGNLIEVAVQAD